MLLSTSRQGDNFAKLFTKTRIAKSTYTGCSMRYKINEMHFWTFKNQFLRPKFFFLKTQRGTFVNI